MACVMKCDRCNRYYDINKRFATANGTGRHTIGGIATQNEQGDEDISYDLCDDCVGAFLEWMGQRRLSKDGR